MTSPRRMSAIRSLLTVCVITMLGSFAARAQVFGGGPAPPTLSHELLLVVAGAIIGGFLGPLCQMIDYSLGISTGAKQQRKNYEIQERMEASRDSWSPLKPFKRHQRTFCRLRANTT